MHNFFTKSNNVWGHTAPSLKSGSFKETTPFTRGQTEWSFIPQILKALVSTTTTTPLQFSEQSRPIKATAYIDGSEIILPIEEIINRGRKTYIVTPPLGDCELDFYYTPSQRIVFPANSVIKEILGFENLTVSQYPTMSSSILTKVPDYLPETITSLDGAFNSCTVFNQQLNWDTAKVTNMNGMFTGCVVFNQPVNFDTSNVINMNNMFFGCEAFNQPVNFDTTNVTTMSAMFFGCAAFNQQLNWDTSKVMEMSHAFNGCTSFNQPVNFDTSNVTNMSHLFFGCAAFNQPLNFDTSNVINMNAMFYGCAAFNQPVNFDTSKVTNFTSMFNNAINFNQDLTNFDTSSAIEWESFNSNSALSLENIPVKFR